MPFMGNSAEFTLVNTSSIRFHDEFKKLGMGVEEFRGVFRHAPLDGPYQHRPQKARGPQGQLQLRAMATGVASQQSHQQVLAAAGDDQELVCPYYLRGTCRYGQACKRLHAQLPGDPASLPKLPTASGNATTKGTPPKRLTSRRCCR